MYIHLNFGVLHLLIFSMEDGEMKYNTSLRNFCQFKLRPRRQSCVSVRKLIRFSRIVHTKTSKHGNENGDFRKRFQNYTQCIVFKTLRFQCGQLKAGAFKNGAEKSVNYQYCRSDPISVFGHLSLENYENAKYGRGLKKSARK